MPYLNTMAERKEAALLLNIGARFSNLFCISPGGLFIRSIAFGGDALTQMLKDALGKSFKAIEKFKIKVFEGEVHLAQDDPSKAMIEDTCQRFLRRLGAEIPRSVASFRRQSAVFVPVRMLLTGPRLPQLRDFLHQRLTIPVEPFEVERDVVVGTGVDAGNVASFADGLSELIGEAAVIRPGLAIGVRIDLLPHALRRRLDFARRRPFFSEPPV